MFATPIFSWEGVKYTVSAPIFVNVNRTSAEVYLTGRYCGTREQAASDQLSSTVYRIVVRPKVPLLVVDGSRPKTLRQTAACRR